MHKLPTLYKKTSTGKIQMWEIYATIGARGREMHEARIITTYGLLDGKKQTAVEFIREGKNIGKANETTKNQQAELEAQSQWEKKVKKGYVQNIEDAEEKKVDTNFITGGIDPMLAQSYDKHASKIQYPAYAQPKLDGHRCIAIYQDGNVTLWSRTRKPINSMPHIVAALEALLADVEFDQPIILDGELYNHDYREKFEELTSKIRQTSPQPGHEVVQYWIYDIVTPDEFSKRQEMLWLLDQKIEELFQADGPLFTVVTAEVEDEEQMVTMFGDFTNLGFEGLMVRNAKSLYKNKRSYDLQKVKLFTDAEFPIVDITSGRGKMEGLAMFHVTTQDGTEFRVKMVGKLDDLKQYLDNKEEYIGKQLTVKYQKLSAEGVPIFPVAMRIREDV